MARGTRADWPLGMALRLTVLAAIAGMLGLVVARTQYFATALVLDSVLALGFTELLRYATRSDRELARVIDALGQGDLADRPRGSGRLSGDSALARAFDTALDRLRARQGETEAQRARLGAVIELAPVPLVAIEADGRVELLNRAARRLFGAVPMVRRSDLLAAAPELERLLGPRGGRGVIRLALPDGTRRFLASVAHSIAGGRGSAIASLQNIQDALEVTEIRAWEELVRVLAHEIMNSLTPVASLAETASHMVAELEPAGPEAHRDLAEAIDAIHRRSFGLIRFVEGYRKFAEPPTPLRRPTPVAELLERAVRFGSGLARERSVRLETRVEPPGLVLDADPDLVDQALINLVRNAIDAAEGSTPALVALGGGLDAAGRVVLTVGDTGKGLAPELADRIFVPFFTTKPHGSGIGLSIVRQIMLAHDGTVEAAASTGGGAEFRLRF